MTFRTFRARPRLLAATTAAPAAFLAGTLALATLAATPLAAQKAAAPASAPASPALEWKSADGRNAFKIGVLGQFQFEQIDDTAAGGDAQQNLFARRLRLLAQYTIGDKVTVYLDTDSPNLGKSDGAGGKNEGDVFVHNFVATYSQSNAFKVDAGVIRLPTSYNHTQSAATLLAMDYSAVTFDEAGPLKARGGNDTGVQIRGYLAGDHLEYRLGTFQGVRGRRAANGRFVENGLRVAGRVVWWAYGAQKTLAYRGTSLGKGRSLGLGVSFDQQEDYQNVAADLFVEQPIAGGNGVSFQADYAKLDGDVFVALPERTNVVAELGFYIARAKLQPYLHYARRDLDRGADVTWSEIGIGRAIAGHNSNLKLAFTRIETDGALDRDQIRLQWQVFAF